MKITLRRAAATLLAGALVSLAGCGSSSSSDTASSAEASSPGASAAAVTITKPWARTSTKVAEAAAGYVTLESAEGDTLTGATVDASIAGSASLHETVAMDGDAMTSEPMGTDTTMSSGAAMGEATTMAGAPAEMTMRPVSEIVLEPGMPVSLEPGGYHIMLEQLVKPLTTGQTFTITLQFAKAGPQDVEFTVSDEAP